ncbi:MAG: NAD-dependent epimerase/dehydratase family protein [Candidatus Solibacter usitatus]|nr:NAD-dependent epimerase/dehydratase family protein [Candidatus Solibacter usitatus]
MKPALVTGVSGFLGWHVAQALIARGIPVRGMARRPESVTGLDAEVIPGDLRAPDSLERAVAGCGLVFHVAADYRLWVKNPKEMYESNVEGARLLLDAARRAGVERFVYTSTVGCIGFVPGGLGDETTPVSLQDMTGHYKRSKWLAEQEALKSARGGFPVVIVNPTAPVGDHDVKPTPTGQTIVDFLRGRMPAFVDTGLNIVDAGETAEGHWLACEKGRPGERYILGSENLTLEQILGHLAAISGRPAPRVKLPWLAAALAGAVSTGLAAVTGKEPRVPLDAVRMARKRMWVTHAKAGKELGFRPSGAEPALRKAVEWFRSNGYC